MCLKTHAGHVFKGDQPAFGSHGTKSSAGLELEREKDIGLAVLEHLKPFVEKVRVLRAIEAIGE